MSHFKQYKIDCRVTIELLDTDSDENEKHVQNASNWSNYVDRMANPVTSSAISTSNQTGNAGTTTTASGQSNSTTTADTSLEIKEEKMDEDVVSENKISNNESVK